MDNDTLYQFQYLNRFSDIVLSSTILMSIGAVIGIIGNTTIILFYFFRIKERGERYFIPLLGILDLIGCLTSPSYFIMYNEYLYIYPSTPACRILAFLQICIPGISAHTLLLISIQRYTLVCKPFGPKMTHFWKRVLFGIICFISFAYSAPLLTTAGVFTDKVTYMNHNVTSEMCKFSGERSLLISIYFMLLFLIMIANIVVTAGLYIPVLRRAKFSFRSRKVKYEINGDGNVDSKTETWQATRTSDVTTQYKMKSKAIIELKTGEIKSDGPNHQRNAKFDILATSCEQPETTAIQYDVSNTVEDNVKDYRKPEKNYKKPKARCMSAQRRVSTMFFYLIVAYVLSYTPPLIILILEYTLDDFAIHTMSKSEMALQTYFSQAVFLNHIVNPFIYGFFDTKFKKQINVCRKRMK